MDRRKFLLAAAAQRAIPGANDRIRTGIIGAGGRGRYLTTQFKEMGAEVAAVCDVYQANLEAGVAAASPGARAVKDYRRVLDDRSLDAVIVATPDHWHARMTIDAVNAGKDVYCEKPMAHTIDEGFQVIEAVRRTRRIVQVGTQRRSAELFIEAKRLMDAGRAGEVRLVTSQWMNNQRALRTDKLSGELDWKQWRGTTPARPEDPVRFFNWYWFWDYSGGLLIGQGAHIIDAIQWLMSSPPPVAVTSVGMHPNIPGAEVPETATIAIEYPNCLATFTLGYRAMRYNQFNDQLKQFHGNNARLDVGREWYALYPESSAIDLKASAENRKPGSFSMAAPMHIRNFLECIRSRNEPNAPVEAGQSTNIVLCMAMESLRTGRRLKWNAQTRRVEA
jgi:predicted dehydrogenase